MSKYSNKVFYNALTIEEQEYFDKIVAHLEARGLTDFDIQLHMIDRYVGLSIGGSKFEWTINLKILYENLDDFIKWVLRLRS